MNGIGKSLATIVGIAVLAALVLPSFAPAASASPVTEAGAAAPHQWAFGGQRWANLTVSFNGGTFTSRAYFGEHVVLTETNTSATTRQIEGVRTVGASYFAQYCRPDCTHPNASANLSLRAWQQLTAFVNLTTTAMVYVHSANGSALVGVAALGIENASSSARGQLHESYSIVAGTHVGAHGSLAVTRTASMGVTFTPALGIYPWNATTGESWNATSAFAAHGGWNDSYTFMDTLRGVATNSSGSSSGSVSHAGTESIRGKYLGNVNLSNGVSAKVIVLGYLGPFAFGDGLFLTEAEADLFGGGSSGWDVHGFASAQASTSAVDMVADGSAHTADLAAASTSTGLGSNSVGAATLQSSGGLTLQPQTPPSANESVQDQPESPQSAQQASQCLVSGCSASGASLGLSGLVLAGIAAAVVVALVGAVLVLVLRRPRRPSGPAGPNPGS